MKKFWIVAILIIFLSFFGNLCLAEDEIVGDKDSTVAENTESEEEMVSEASEPAVEEDPGAIVENLIGEYLNNGSGKAIRKKIETEGGWIGSSTAEVSVGPENPDWAKHRVIAYEKALIDIENQYVTSHKNDIGATKVKEFFKNASGTVPDFKPEDMGDPSKLKKILDKLLAVGEGKLDNELEALGVDVEQFNKAPLPQRHTLLSESLSKSTMVESIGSLSGLIPVQTFEGFNAKKAHVIGIVSIATPNLKQFAYDILHSRGNFDASSKKGKNLYELFSADKNLLVDQFGIRKMKDEDGYPVLISFGQWSNSKKTGDDRLNRRYREAAKKQAEASAKNQIALFLAGNSVYQSASDIGEQIEDSINVQHDNYKEKDPVNAIMDGIREKSRSRASITMSGLVQLYSWTAKHPQYGHEIVGVVMKWSPGDEKSARQLKDWKPEKKQTVKNAPAAGKPLKGAAGSKTGQEYIDTDDF